MTGAGYVLLIDVILGIAGAMVVAPLLFYLYRIWATRRDRLFSYLGANSLCLYYRQFYPDQRTDEATVAGVFMKYFSQHYGRRFYVLPVFLLTVLTVTCACGAARTLQVWQQVDSNGHALPGIVMGALGGGFTWVISDLIDRVRRRDLTVGDVYNFVFRILIAAPFGWAFAQLVKDEIGVPLAFLLGAFPTSTLFRIARRLAATKLGVSDDPDSGKLELENLQSIGKTNAERFNDEGISTIVQMAYVDPIDLTIRTNFDFNYVIDCVSQALLWIYFEDKTHTLVNYSLRGAQEACSLVKALKSAQQAERDEATTTLSAIAAALNMAPACVQTTLEQIGEDPYTEFISSIWH
jgi:hypothetical protein